MRVIVRLMFALALVAGITRSSLAQPTTTTPNPPEAPAEKSVPCTEEQKKLSVETDAPVEGTEKTVFEGQIGPCVDHIDVTVYEEPEIVPAPIPEKPTTTPAPLVTAPTTQAPTPNPDWLTVGGYASVTTYGPFGEGNFSPNVFKGGLSLRHPLKRWLTAELDLDGGLCRRADRNYIAAGGTVLGDIRMGSKFALGFGLSGNYCLDSDAPGGELTNSHQWSLVARATIAHRVQAMLGPTWAGWFNRVGKHGSAPGVMLGIALPF